MNCIEILCYWHRDKTFSRLPDKKQCKNVMDLLTEKIAEAARKFAGLQSDLSRSVTETGYVADGNGLRRRHIRKLPVKGSIDKAVHKSMHDIKLAFSEFYLSLILLQNYQTLNFTGFRKILKKHDKVSRQFSSSICLRFYSKKVLLMSCHPLAGGSYVPMCKVRLFLECCSNFGQMPFQT